MAKVIAVCGKIGSGKSFYAEKIRKANKAVVLSCDEITLTLFHQDMGEIHNEMVSRTKKYLFEKSIQILEIGCNVILDWGFWTKEDRDYVRDFYKKREVVCELHYIDVSEEQWKRNLAKRNQQIRDGRAVAYYFDDELANLFAQKFEVPTKAEIDFWLKSKS